MKIKNERGFGGLELLIILLVVGILGMAAWYAYQATQNKTSTYKSSVDSSSDGTSTPTTYQECVSTKGSVVLQSYPSQCKTTGGKSFTNPAESAPAAPKAQ